MGFRVSLFSGAEEFLHARAAVHTDCLILDIHLGGMSGAELQRELSTGSHRVTPRLEPKETNLPSTKSHEKPSCRTMPPQGGLRHTNPSEKTMDIDRKLSPVTRTFWLAIIGGILIGIIGFFAYAGGWLTPRKLTPGSVVDTFEKINGVHSGFRRNHAKGVCFRGYFESNGNGVALARAAVFPAGRIPVIGRFSLGGGQPYVADAPSTVRALAVLFQLPDGEEWRTAMINLPVFPVQNVQQFREQLLASAPDPTTGKPDPEKMKAFVAAHPATAKALPLIQNRAISAGFSDSTYYGLNAFRFIDANGRSTPGRWSMVPEQPFQPNTAADPEKTDKNYLFDALIAAVHQGPQKWRLVITVGEPGDPTNDATVPWPADRQKIDAGTLVVEQIESEAVSPARDINFDPTILPDGIAVSDDPLLSARSATYSQSFTRREGESKEPSAVSTAETEK